MAEYIEREALYEDIKRSVVFSVRNAPSAEMRGANKILDRIRRAPAPEVAPVVHGRWINWGKSGTPTYENYGTCSVCHEDAEIHTEHRNYCPNCGARMGGE